MTQDEADSLHVAHELALDDAQREMSDFGETIGSCLMCGRRDIGVIGGRVLQSYGDHYSYLDTTTTSDGTPIYESRGFNGAQHTWYLLNSEVRRIGEIFAQAPDKFELVNDDRSGAFCRIYALDSFERQVVRDIAAAMRWTSPRKEAYYHITNTARGYGGGSHWVAVVLEIEKTERPEATAAAAGTAVVQQHETPHVLSLIHI